MLKLDPKQGWVKVRVEQFNFLVQPTRLFLIRANMMGIPMIGFDSYLAGRGRMFIKLAGLLTVADAQGPETDQAELVTLFNDICLWSPAGLLNGCFQWEMIEPLVVKGVLTYQYQTVSAVLYFNEQGQLVNFVTDDRYYATREQSYLKVRWSTPIQASDYREVNGVNVPVFGGAIWHFETGDHYYAKFRLQELKYNCSQFE